MLSTASGQYDGWVSEQMNLCTWEGVLAVVKTEALHSDTKPTSTQLCEPRKLLSLSAPQFPHL